MTVTATKKAGSRGTSGCCPWKEGPASQQDILGIKRTILGAICNKLHSEKLKTTAETPGSMKEKSKLEQKSEHGSKAKATWQVMSTMLGFLMC